MINWVKKDGSRCKIDARWIVKYNPKLLLKYDCHLNIEVSGCVESINYRNTGRWCLRKLLLRTTGATSYEHLRHGGLCISTTISCANSCVAATHQSHAPLVVCSRQ